MGKQEVLVQVEFYHGLHLQDSKEDMQELTDIGSRMSSLQEFIKRNYGMYQQSLEQRRERSSDFSTWLVIALVLVVIGTAVGQVYIFFSTKKYLKYKKIL